MWVKGETVKKNNSSALGQGAGSPSGDTPRGIFELFADTETPSRWEKWTINRGRLLTCT